VIGIFGPITSKTVLAYKRHYDIHVPPDAPTSLVRGRWTCSTRRYAATYQGRRARHPERALVPQRP
jgi:hypothetical protein